MPKLTVICLILSVFIISVNSIGKPRESVALNTETTDYPNGQTLTYKVDSTGRKQGEAKLINKDGILQETSTYVDDQKHGEVIGFERDGKIKYKVIYKNDIRLSYESYKSGIKEKFKLYEIEGDFKGKYKQMSLLQKS